MASEFISAACIGCDGELVIALLENKTAVVTGRSSGIARGFAEHGAEAVVVTDVREDPKEGGLPTHELLEEETDTSSVYVECAVTNQADLAETVEAAEAAGGIDIMVNNAGIWHAEEFFEVTEDEYKRMMDINFKGVYFGSQIAAEYLVQNDDEGAIINISISDWHTRGRISCTEVPKSRFVRPRLNDHNPISIESDGERLSGRR